MKIIKIALVPIIALLVFGLAVGPAGAQSSDVITAEVDRTTLTTDHTLVLTVMVDQAAGDASRPQVPPLGGFKVLGSSSGTQMSIVNGAMSVNATYQIRLQPTQTGNLVINPISVTVNGNSYSTQPIAVNVTQGTGVPQPSNPGLSQTMPGFPSLGSFGSLSGFPSLLDQLTAPPAPTTPMDPADASPELAGQDFLIEAIVDNPTPFQGEQVNYTLRFYQAVSVMRQIEYQQPSFTGFWSDKEPEQASYSLQAAGRDYQVTELTNVLFPTVVGEVIIDPATLNIPGGFFSGGQAVNSRPVTLMVKSLPDQAPASFRGAVGRFAIQAEADTVATKVNDTVTMKVTLSGQGNVATMGEPAWPDLPEWRAFDSQGTVQTIYQDGQMVGTHIYDRVLVPTTAGNLMLPAVEYSYFDPETGAYETISSEPIAINVEADGSALAAPSTLPVGGSGTDALVNTVEPQLRPMKAAPLKWNRGNPGLARQAGYWLLWTVPVFMLAGHFGWQTWHRSRRQNVSQRRSQAAGRKARHSLRQAKGLAQQDPARAYNAAGQILTGYIADKLNRTITGLTQDGLGDVLLNHGVEPELVDGVLSCLMLSEMGWYSPAVSTMSTNDILAETERLITDLEKAF